MFGLHVEAGFTEAKESIDGYRNALQFLSLAEGIRI